MWLQVRLTAGQVVTTMNILIADDHANVRRGLREILVDAFSGSLFSEAADGDQVTDPVDKVAT